jgi:hypothetical protein
MLKDARKKKRNTFKEAQAMSDLINLPKAHIKVLDNLIIHGKVIEIVCHYGIFYSELAGHPVTKSTLAQVMRHIADRTICWGTPKVVEHIQIEQIVGGMLPKTWVLTSGLSARGVHYALRALEHLRLLIKIKDDTDPIVFYGIHWPNFCNRLQEFFGSDDMEEFRWRAEKVKVYAYRLQLIDAITYKMNEWQELFDALLDIKFSEATSIIRRERMKLEESMKLARARIARETKAREGKKAQEWLYEMDDKQKIKVNTMACMESWYQAMEEAGIALIERAHTGKTLGQMKNWITELLVSNGMNEDQIREHMLYICSSWVRIQGQTIRKATTYEVFVPSYPTFEFYYTWRRDLSLMLSAPSKVAIFRTYEENGDRREVEHSHSRMVRNNEVDRLCRGGIDDMLGDLGIDDYDN